MTAKRGVAGGGCGWYRPEPVKVAEEEAGDGTAQPRGLVVQRPRQRGGPIGAGDVLDRLGHFDAKRFDNRAHKFSLLSVFL